MYALTCFKPFSGSGIPYVFRRVHGSNAFPCLTHPHPHPHGRINEIMDPNNIQRHQYNTNPDSSYGAVFQLDTLVDVIPGLIYPAWLEVCAD